MNRDDFEHVFRQPDTSVRMDGISPRVRGRVLISVAEEYPRVRRLDVFSRWFFRLSAAALICFMAGIVMYMAERVKIRKAERYLKMDRSELTLYLSSLHLKRRIRLFGGAVDRNRKGVVE